MESAENREKVYRALQEALRQDKAKTNILKISELGLVEMTRKRTRENLVQQLCEPCSYCDGTRLRALGARASPTRCCARSARTCRASAGARSRVSVNPRVAEMLLGPARKAPAALAERARPRDRDPRPAGPAPGAVRGDRARRGPAGRDLAALAGGGARGSRRGERAEDRLRRRRGPGHGPAAEDGGRPMAEPGTASEPEPRSPKRIGLAARWMTKPVDGRTKPDTAALPRRPRSRDVRRGPHAAASSSASSPGERVRVEKLPGAVGDTVELAEVLLVGGEGEPRVGTPLVWPAPRWSGRSSPRAAAPS